MVCFGGICLGNIWQILLAVFLISRIWSTYREGKMLGGSKTNEWKGPENAQKRRIAEQSKRLAPMESITNIAGLKTLIDRMATDGPSFMKRDGTRYFLLKFSAGWCQPCIKIAPFVDLLRYCYKFALVTIDIDLADAELRKHANAVPTFILLKLEANAVPVSGRDWLGLSVVDKMQGGSSSAIESMLAKHCSPQDRIQGSTAQTNSQ